jgi:predicted RecB family endonuclease
LRLRDRQLTRLGRNDHRAELRELEPNVLPAQRRAIERVAVRLSSQRPAPRPAFLAELDARIQGLPRRDGGPAPSSRRLWTWVCLASGLALLLLAVLLVVLGEPGGY